MLRPAASCSRSTTHKAASKVQAWSCSLAQALSWLDPLKCLLRQVGTSRIVARAMEHGDFADTIDRLCDEFRERLVSAYESLRAPPTEGALRGPSKGVTKAQSVASSRAGSRPISRASSPSGSSHSHSLSAHSTRVVWSGQGNGERNANIISMTSSSMESDHIPHGDSSTIFRSVLANLTPEEARTVRHRLRWRLGAMSSKTIVSGKVIHDAVSTLGLTTYTEEDMNDFVNLLADFIKLSFAGSSVYDNHCRLMSCILHASCRRLRGPHSIVNPKPLLGPTWQTSRSNPGDLNRASQVDCMHFILSFHLTGSRFTSTQEAQEAKGFPSFCFPAIRSISPELLIGTVMLVLNMTPLQASW